MPIAKPPTLTLLLIDDSQTDRDLCRRFMRPHQESYTVIEAETGSEALYICRECRPDLILLDYFLPDYDGLDLFPRIQNLLGVATVPTILLTGHGDTKIVREAVQAGVQDYLVKDTLTPDLLHRTLTKVLEQWQLQKTLRRQQIQQELVRQCALRMLQSLNLDQILATTVDSLRTALGVDRAIVIQLHPDHTSTVVAEARQEGCSSCLKQHLPAYTWQPFPDVDISEIMSPKAKDIENIEDIEALALEIAADHWDNQSFFATYPLELLNRWQVQSQFVVPIWVTLPDQRFHDQPWGLLVVHQCDRGRSWLPIEIELLKELTVHLAVAIRQTELFSQQERANIQLQAELRRQKEQNQAILRTSSDLIIQMDKQGHYLNFINGRDRGVILPPKTPLSANTVQDVLPTPQAQEYLRRIALTLATNSLQVYQQSLQVDDLLVHEEVRMAPCGPDRNEVLIIVRELAITPL